MANYSEADLQGAWEFKILRSNTGGFGNPETLRQACAEEAKAGWVLVEKFDNQRLRFKRPISARAGDAGVGFDPYRSYYGVSSGAMVAIILVSVFLGVTALFAVIALATR